MAMTGAGPGTRPHAEPDPRPPEDRADRCLQILERRIEVAKARDDHLCSRCSSGWSTLERTSAIPKSPMATATNSMPLSR